MKFLHIIHQLVTTNTKLLRDQWRSVGFLSTIGILFQRYITCTLQRDSISCRRKVCSADAQKTRRRKVISQVQPQNLISRATLPNAGLIARAALITSALPLCFTISSKHNKRH